VYGARCIVKPIKITTKVHVGLHMHELHDMGKVDLRFAKAYLPICIVSVELLALFLLTLPFPLPPTEAWMVAGICVWFLRRIVVEEVIQYNSLLETAILSSVITQYRMGIAPISHVGEISILNGLWVTCFCSTNVYLSRPSTHDPLKKKTIWLWMCTLALVLYSTYTPISEHIFASENIKTALFIYVSISWVYIHDQTNLFYTRVHNCEDCKLRFLPVLFTPLLVSLTLVILFVASTLYYLLYKKGVENGTNAPLIDTIPSYQLPHNTTIVDEDQDLFRLALQEGSKNL
jgi:hypothetical protein